MSNASSRSTVEISMPVFVETGGYYKYPDAELIRRCLKGEDPAWAALLDRYGSFIYSIAAKFDLPSDDIAYVFQAVFLEMLQNLEKFGEDPQLDSWLTTVTLWQCRQLAEPELLEEGLSESYGDSPRLYQEIEQMEQERVIRQSLSLMEVSARRRLLTLLEGGWSDQSTDQMLDFSWPMTTGAVTQRGELS